MIPDVDPDDIAVVATDRSFTWDELERRACRLANSLDAAGIAEGGVWAALLHNRIEWPEIVLGNSRAGSRYVPLNWHLTANELAELLTDSGATLLVVDPSLREVADAAAAIGRVERIIELGDEYEAWLSDAGDEPPSERQIGTIYCKRVDGAPEYYGDEEKTASIQLPDGRFTVGDIGWLDDDDYLYLAERRVDLIITGGSNVYPAEIEAVLVEHPAVGDAAVFGIPDPDMGQQIKAVLEAAGDEAIDIDSIRTFVAERLAKFKVPKSFDVIDALSREAHGKLKKRILREPYWQ